MRLVGIKSLKPGDELAYPVQTCSGKAILNSGVVLTDVYIKKLQELGISKAYIVDQRFSDVEIIQSIDVTTRNNVVKALTQAYKTVQDSKSPDEYSLKDAAKEIVEYIRKFGNKGISMLSTEAIDEYVVEHSVNVAILVAFLGNRMSYNINQLYDIVAAALIHDIGRKNTPDERSEHVKYGFEAMRKLRGLSLHSSIVCYEHHENYDGTGYPRKLKGSSISEYSRVVRLADFYDNELHGYNNNNESQMPHQAFESVLAVAGQVLDPDIVEIFRDTIIFYPNGCTVLLSNGLNGMS
jgi:HD-GYP domain-containing protein (c-di-GMP phosphodiesterase class II)